MRWNVWVPLLCSLLLISQGCKKRETPKPIPKASEKSNQVQIDACGLITSQEIEAVQGSPIKETKSSARSDAGFRVSQCFYTATEFSKSVNLALIERDPGHQSRSSPKDFWKEKFDPYENEQPQIHSGGEKEKGPAPKKIGGLGDDAYWLSNRFGGVLYVLKGEVFISIGLGGTDDEETKLKKSKVLAQKALQ